MYFLNNYRNIDLKAPKQSFIKRLLSGRIFSKKTIIFICLIILLVLNLAVIKMVNAFYNSFTDTPELSEEFLLVNHTADFINKQSIENLTTEYDYEPESMDKITEVIPDKKVNLPKLPTSNKLHFYTHIVKEGESLWSIAKNYKISVAAIVSANADKISKSNYLSVNQKLVIPSKNGVFIKLRKGQTLWDISKNYNVSIKDILKENNISNERLIKSGKVLFIPGAKVNDYRSFLTVKRKKGFIWPVSRSFKRISSSFGYRIHPIKKTKIFHEGIDIVARYGSNVYSAKQGRVSFVGWIRGYGRTVVINHHKGYSTRYAHLSRYTVYSGQYVEQGQIIGKVGSSGLATGAHLHFEVRKNNRPRNPIKYLRR